jgi:putative acetyltransferase
MAVLPEFQNRGIGSALVRAGLEACRNIGESVVFVLGHLEFYPRFGFQPAAQKGLRYKSLDFDPHFMVAELSPGALKQQFDQV